jgi:hypothetical protein
MKFLLIASILFSSMGSFAGSLNVHCGEIVKVKEKTKNPLPFPISLIAVGLRLPALKVKLKNAENFIDGGIPGKGEKERTFKNKYAFSNSTNYEKLHGILTEALEEKERLQVPVYACIGEVSGLDRWHKVASYSLRSSDDAFEELRQKYR